MSSAADARYRRTQGVVEAKYGSMHLFGRSRPWVGVGKLALSIVLSSFSVSLVVVPICCTSLLVAAASGWLGAEIDETGAGNDAEDDDRFFVEDRRFFRRMIGGGPDAWVGAGDGDVCPVAALTNTAPLPPS